MVTTTSTGVDLDAIRGRDAEVSMFWLDLVRDDVRPGVRAMVDRRDLLAEVTRLTEALDAAGDTRAPREQVRQWQRDAVYCCQHGCGSGACETCPCCAAGWCVMGADGTPYDLPDATPQDRAQWLEVAAQYNPVAALLADRVTRVARAHGWVLNAVDGAKVGFAVKQEMLDYLAAAPQAPSGFVPF